MKSNVPDTPPGVDPSEIRSGKPVQGSDQWVPMSEVANYLNGNEITLVSAFSSDLPIDYSRGGTGTFDFIITPRRQVRRILWVITFKNVASAAGTPSFSGTIQVGSGTTFSYAFSGNEPKYIFILQSITPTTSPYAETVTITLDSNSYVLYTYQIAAYQVRRYHLDPDAGTSEHASDTVSCESGGVIKDDTGYSVDGVVDGITTAKENCRRASLFAWSHHTIIRVGQGSSWNNLFHESPEVLGRLTDLGPTVTSVSVYAYLKDGNDGNTAQLRFVADSGDSATFVGPFGGTLVWTVTTINIYTEYAADTKGRRSGADRITIAVYGNGNTVDSEYFAAAIKAICIGET